jgi:hypothetical protein
MMAPGLLRNPRRATHGAILSHRDESSAEFALADQGVPEPV